MSTVNTPGRACRVCGCTDESACEGGCYWVEWDLCSECLVRLSRAARQLPELGRSFEPDVTLDVNTMADASCPVCRERVQVSDRTVPPFVPFDVSRLRGETYLFVHPCLEAISREAVETVR